MTGSIKKQLRLSVSVSSLLLLLFLMGCGAGNSGPENKNASGESGAGKSASNSNEGNQTGPKSGLAQTSPLITATELKRLIESKKANLRIVEPGREPSDFAKGHISGAQFIHWVKDMTDFRNHEHYTKPDARQFEHLMGRLGIRNSDHIVIYDRLNSRLSTRLYWTLKFFGHDQIQILDGGIKAWQSNKYPVTEEDPPVTPTKYLVTESRSELVAEMDHVKAQLELEGTRLIDGRPKSQFSGEQPGVVFHTNQEHKRRGHIPGAVNIFWKDNFNDDGTFKSIDDLKLLYQANHVLPNDRIITYCNEGLHAAPPWFVLTQLLNYKSVRLYDNSMAEWTKSDTPMQKHH